MSENSIELELIAHGDIDTTPSSGVVFLDSDQPRMITDSYEGPGRLVDGVMFKHSHALSNGQHAYNALKK